MNPYFSCHPSLLIHFWFWQQNDLFPIYISTYMSVHFQEIAFFFKLCQNVSLVLPKTQNCTITLRNLQNSLLSWHKPNRKSAISFNFWVIFADFAMARSSLLAVLINDNFLLIIFAPQTASLNQQAVQNLKLFFDSSTPQVVASLCTS